MEDRIYYVESPDGGVLGPMTMIEILEGIAAGILLETARICEVGRSDWVELSEVVATRDNGEWEEASPNEPIEEPGPAIVQTALVDTDLSETQLHHIQTAALHEMDLKQEFGLDTETELEVAGVSLEPDEIEEPVVISPDAYFSPLSMPSLANEPPPRPPSETFHVSTDLFPVSGADPAADEAFEHDPDFGLLPTLGGSEPLAIDTHIGSGDLDRTIRIDESYGQPGAYAGRDSYEEVEEEPVHSGTSSSGTFDEIVIGDGHDDFALELPEGHAAPIVSERMAAPRRPRPNPLVPVLAGVGAAAALAAVFFVLHLGSKVKVGGKSRDASNGKSSSAQAELAPASDSDHKKALAFLESGRGRLRAQDSDGAIDAFTQAIALDARLSEARAELARALAAGGRKSPAIEEMTRYLDSVPDDYVAQRERLDWMIATGDRGEAAMIYGDLAAKSPDVAELQLMAGLATGETNDALAFLRRATELDRKNADAFVALAAAYERAGRPVDAVAAYESAFALRPATSQEERILAKAKEDAKNAKPSEPEKPVEPARSPEFTAAIREIRAALELENYDDARKEIDVARKTFGKDAEASRNLALWRGITDFEEGRYERALTQFESLDEKASYDASGWGRGSVSNWVARTCIAQGDYRSAVLAFGLVDGADPDEIATAKLWEGVALQSLGMEELARRMWKQMPEEVGTLVQGSGKGAVKTAQFLTGALGEKEYLKSVSAIADFQNDMHYFLGRVAKTRDDAPAALGHFQRALESSRGREFPYGLALRETSPDSPSPESSEN